MTIRSLTYQQIPTAVRAQKAQEANRRLQAILSDPLATTEQREAARQRQVTLRQWSAGTLPSTPPPPPETPPESTPEDHVVEVSESLSVSEG